MQPHEAILYVRGNCSGDCVDDDAFIASFTFRDQSAAVALDSLAYALGNGSAWRIAGSDLYVQKSGSGAANLPALNIRRDLRDGEGPGNSGKARGNQGRGNSGIFFMGLYELQVLDSYENPTYSNGQVGSIYKQHIPLANASRGPGEWQREEEGGGPEQRRTRSPGRESRSVRPDGVAAHGGLVDRRVQRRE